MSDITRGEVKIEGEHATLVFERQLKHSPETVWEALTDPAQLQRWYMSTVKSDWRKGGNVEGISGTARFQWKGKILEWDPPRLYEYEWNVEPRTELPKGEQSVVRWELQPTKGGTLLRLTHRRLTKNTALGFAPGTHAFIDRLAAHLAKEPLPDWMQRYGEVARSYPPMPQMPQR